MNFHNRKADVHQFAMVPRADVPRSAFKREWGHKTAFDSGYLVPVYVDEVLPGDSFNLQMSVFARLATPIFPFMDNLTLESFFFFVPMRLVWTNFERFMGYQASPADSISFTIPQVVSPAGGFAVGSTFDFMGLPTTPQLGANTVSVNCLPLRAYNLIYEQWFKDENLQNTALNSFGDGPDANTWFPLKRRGKRHDYFTSCLPWPLKGGVNVTLPLGTEAAVKTKSTDTVTGAQTEMKVYTTAGAAPSNTVLFGTDSGGNRRFGTWSASAGAGAHTGVYPSNLYADLSTATAATVNQLRQAFQIQRLLEREARGGTRYTELVQAHFGVLSPDARLQRPEYLGGGSTPMNVNPVAQTSGTGQTGQTTPLGNLASFVTAHAAHHGFSASFTEHGYVIGIVNVRAELSYQQGIQKMWSRSTKYDFYFPAFAMLGEQAVLNREIYAQGSSQDTLVFGYQERWAEYRYFPSKITGLMRSTAASNIDEWHLAQNFTSLPTLNATFIEDTPPLDRVLAVGAAANGQQVLFDSFFSCRTARAMPLYSVPGLIDHF